MTVIKNVNLVVDVLGRWDPGDLAFIQAFRYESEQPPHKSKLVLSALFQRRDLAKPSWPSVSAPYAEVTIEFQGISNLQVKAVGPKPKQITGFSIRDISNDGWEKVTFTVEDYESGHLGFNCQDAFIVSAQAATPIGA
jgi:hypothetical protein